MRWRRGDTRALDAAIAHGERALVEGTRTDTVLEWLAHAYQLRFDACGDPADADAQVRHAEHGLAVAEPAGVRRAHLLELAASGYERRHGVTGEAEDLDAAITLRESAVATGWSDALRRSVNLSNLCSDYLERSRTTRDPADVRRAVNRGSEALEAAGTDTPVRSEVLHRLGLAHHARFLLDGDIADLDTFVELAEAACRCAPAGSVGIALLNLAGAHEVRYGSTGDHRDLDAGIERLEEALAGPGLPKQFRGSGRFNLAGLYRTRFHHFGAKADIDHAISMGHRALRALPPDHPELARMRTALAHSYSERFDRDPDLADLDAAVDLCEGAVAATGTGHSDRPLMRSQLGMHLLQRFRAAGDPADLEAGIDHLGQALAGVDEDGQRWPEVAGHLAGALHAQHRIRPRPGQLERVIDLVGKALARTPSNSQFFLARLGNVAVVHQDETVDPRRRMKVVEQLLTAVDAAPATSPTMLMRVLTDIGHLAVQAGRLTDAAATWRRAVELLPRCAPQGLPWADQERQLSNQGGLVGEATAALLATGDVAAAVEVAELGRGVLLSNQLDSAPNLARVAQLAPEHAAEFERLAAELDTRARLDSYLPGVSDAIALPRPPRHLANRWEQLVDRIRDLPGLGDFLAPARLTDLQRAAAGGAIVIVNAATLGGDAVVLTPGSAVRVRLPGLVEADVDAAATGLAGIEIVTEHPAARDTTVTRDLLAWLWQAVAEPVLTELGYDAPPDPAAPLPRIWWVGIGKAGLLPLHAAGLPGGPSTLDRVISSYTPTVRMLAAVRHRRASASRVQLAVGLQRTDGLPDLPATTREIARLFADHPETITISDGEATSSAVLDALPRASWVHFACHATSHPRGASRSGLHLHDRTLLVPEICRAALPGGELAYLSACSTGRGTPFHPDNAVHLASAFHIAGYRHVVATLWTVNDQIAARAARHFYRQLGTARTADGAAAAVHDVARHLRRRYPDHPEAWAGFVHSGP